MGSEISKRLFTVHDYHRMVDAGILSEDDRVELIRGEILAMSPIGPRHSAAVLRANQSLVRIAGDRAIVGVQGSIRNERLIAYFDRKHNTYQTIRQFQRGETVVPQLLQNFRIPVDTLLP